MDDGSSKELSRWVVSLFRIVVKEVEALSFRFPLGCLMFDLADLLAIGSAQMLGF